MSEQSWKASEHLEGGKSEHKALRGSGWEDGQGGSSHTKFYRLQPRVELIPFVISEALALFKSIFSNSSQGTEISKNLRKDFPWDEEMPGG